MSVASKNLYDLLGNDIEDGENQPKGPVKTVDKTTMRTTKRDVEPVAPAKPAAATANTGRRGPGGNEGAFRDRTAGHSANQRRPTDEAARGGPRGGRGARQRGGRGGGYPRDRDDRHARGLASGSDKQAAQSWGAQEGEAEQKDEQAGEAIARTELKEAVAEDAQDPETPAEPENKSISYDDYLAQQLEKKAALGENLQVRKANEGSKADKKWSNAKELVKDDKEDFIAGNAGKAKRERERKQKAVVDIDHSFVEPDRPRGGARGGRGGPRGGRGEGGRGRGEGRGGRGGQRGGRSENPSLNPSDQSAFPSLGA
ncbi:putative Hyaluronan/mRNA-binding protein domain-containing protein [Seiridium cardinale]|uniref:Hyaluronan/mRNA-binding protein domain-containing protein n=1 Tax=Seiridium cardinale TaxID=138064 RepID=A0ABR2Y0G3_9PEZI